MRANASNDEEVDSQEIIFVENVNLLLQYSTRFTVTSSGISARCEYMDDRGTTYYRTFTEDKLMAMREQLNFLIDSSLKAEVEKQRRDLATSYLQGDPDKEESESQEEEEGEEEAGEEEEGEDEEEAEENGRNRLLKSFSAVIEKLLLLKEHVDALVRIGVPAHFENMRLEDIRDVLSSLSSITSTSQDSECIESLSTDIIMQVGRCVIENDERGIYDYLRTITSNVCLTCRRARDLRMCFLSECVDTVDMYNPFLVGSRFIDYARTELNK